MGRGGDPKSSLFLFHNQEANQGLGQVWEVACGEGARTFQSLAGRRGEVETTSEGEKQPVASPTPNSPGARAHTHTHTQKTWCLIPLAIVPPPPT